ncbi:methyltransferase domain-containing protein [Ornithinimicrobium pekingense]|uniref:23S rRNA (Uracil(747)-C(5))-methyltransferase n=1 Tax=Ornithinimicrobium pekingense TaxID=384677 RepID=A0ABQ2FA10_9MICO|nr:methyltransferase domain-containing protein [Ornithinimicrobium pekingense]GGK75965.1 23S rRNA (uracil(747)-C(5))-methyltransferase [Ornithinimicrobium pekingense]
MQCDYFDAGVCRSCALMGVPYPVQLARTQEAVATTLREHVPGSAWSDPFAGPEQGFRNKAKLVVAGTRGRPTFGVLDGDGGGVDLRHCGLYEPPLARAVPVLADLVSASGLVPYDVPSRQGELKHLLVTSSPDGELMVRLVLRSPGQLPRVRELLEPLVAALPGTRVVSVNLQPEHKAVLEGPEEIVLTPAQTLPMRLDDVTLQLRPQSFFQTNTVVAAGLYRQARAWVEEAGPETLWDLYCGVGGFALHLATPGRAVLGVERSAEAVASARASAAGQGLGQVRFEVGDATSYLAAEAPPACVVVNPPRRGIGPLAGWLEASGVPRVLYSSCNATSLARDLAAMPTLRARRARLFDMFPQSRHSEVLVELVRDEAPQPSAAIARS